MSSQMDQDTDSTTTSTLIEGIDRVDLRVTGLESALGFYRDVVGLEVAEQEQGRSSLRPPGGPVMLTLTSEGVDGPAERGVTGLFHVAIRFPNRRALADVLVRLVNAGHRIGAGDHGVSEALYVDDPDGNGIELYHDRPREEWPEPAPGERVGMFTAPMDLDDLVRESEPAKALGSQALSGTDIGHVHLQVGDLDRTISFYVEALGLDLMARLGDQAAFMSSRNYHHHIGCNTWNSKGGRPASRNRAGLDRVVFRVETGAKLDRARERLTVRGYEPRGSDDELIVSDPDEIELHFVLGA